MINKGKKQVLNKSTNFRYERKFTATATHRSEFILQIKKHPAFFREIYHARQVNNIYLDTLGLKFYNDNKIGISDRKKVRIRWYGDTMGKISKPKLEYKIKSGLLGTKWTFALAGFELNNDFSKKYISDIFHQSNLPEEILADLKMLSPTLINSYKRTYFLSADEKYRLTFDEQLKYYRPDIFRFNVNRSFQDDKWIGKKEENNHFILELKYGQDEDPSANHISNLFPYRLDKSSKYVSGIDLIK